MSAVKLCGIAPWPTNASTGRRCTLIRLAILPFAIPTIGVAIADQGVAGDALEQLPAPDAAHFMQRALEMKQLAIDTGDQAYGAIVVKDGRIVGQAPSRVIVNSDPTAHGEMEALRDAARRLGSHDLSGCVLYTSAKPCRMCETACYWARIEQVWFGERLSDAGQPHHSSC